MKVLVCTGDSHTWGQGARGICDSDMPRLFGENGVVSGDLRPVPFERESYVGRIRAAFPGEAREFSAAALAGMWRCPLTRECAHVTGRVEFSFEGGLIRLFMARFPGSRLAIEIDGEQAGDPDLEIDAPRWNDPGVDCAAFRLRDGRHKIALWGNGLIYRMETYAGEWAVVNAGVGSCSAGEYREHFLTDWVAACRPDMILAEAHTINDWLRPQSPNQYREALTGLLLALRGLCSQVYCMTVSPILGAQTHDLHAFDYNQFVSASRQAAQAAGVPILDANAAIPARPDMFSDCWHGNSRVHEIYARVFLESLKRSR